VVLGWAHGVGRLLAAVNTWANVRTRAVEYLTLTNINKDTIAIKDLPFLKRHPFKPENEFRILYESKKHPHPSLDKPIPLSCIKRITLSPWLHPRLKSPVMGILKPLFGSASIEVVRSTLINNQKWRETGDAAA
jgi:hypothetical protein